MKRHLRRAVLAGIAAVIAIQLVPYGRAHSNPPVTSAAVFRSAAVRQIVAGSCSDCHSNLTKWPWYTNVAPASWLVANDVDGGRNVMNLSAWTRRSQPELSRIVDVISSGGMPPLKYKVMPNHARARLSHAQKSQLIAGFRQLYAAQPPATHGRSG